MLSNLFKKKRVPATAGFGLVELLVTMTIMALVSAVVLVNDSSFKGAVVMRNQAYEVAFMLRQAQLLAVGASDDATTANQSFGVRIDSVSNTVILFSDSSNPAGYNTGDVVIDRRQLDSRFIFNQPITNSSVSPAPVAVVDVIFTRPNFDARVLDGSGTVRPGTVFIDIGMAGSSATRRIEVLSGGSISVLSN